MAENRVLDANFAFSLHTLRLKLEEFSGSTASYIDVAGFDLRDPNGIERDLVMRSELEGIAFGTKSYTRVEIPTETNQPRRWIQDTDYHLGSQGRLSVLARRRAISNIFRTELRVAYTYKVGSLTIGENPAFKLPFPAQEYLRGKFEDVE